MEKIFFAILGAWLLLISVIFFWFFKRLNGIIKDANRQNFLKTLDKILSSQRKNKKDIDRLISNIDSLEGEVKLHIQKVGLVRFNPFSDIGGDHSFSLALLNGKDTGVVITGLHTRERTRLYIKSIKKGKSELELSEEEKKAIARAQKERD